MQTTGPLAPVVEGEPLEMALPAALPPAPFAPIGDDELTGRRDLVFSRHAPEVDAAGHWREFAFLVDDRLFDHDRVDQVVELGAVEERTVSNADDHNDHVFHIHVNPFGITAVNGEPVAEPTWLDTAIVPRGGGIAFSRFRDFAGRYVFHWHVMNHEELGMMQVVEAVPLQPDARTQPSSGRPRRLESSPLRPEPAGTITADSGRQRHRWGQAG